jgi:D-arginine dehydrogenase
MEKVETLIVGGGIAGLTTAWHLARAGRQGIVLVEKERFLGTQSSGRNAAILRTVGPDPLTTTLGQRSADVMRTPPEGFTEVPLIDPCGLLLLGDADHGDTLAGWVKAAGPNSGGREISVEGLRREAPFYQGEADRIFSFPTEGRIDIAALMAGFAGGARAAGATIRSGVSVSRLNRQGTRVTGVRLTDGTDLVADVTVLAAGGWAGQLGAEAGSRVVLRPTRRHLMVTAPHPGIDSSWPVLWALGDDFYCRPESGGMLLCACDQTEVEPGDCRRDDDVCEVIAHKTARLLPDFGDVQAARFWCGLRTLTSDDRFAIGYDPDVEGLFWVAGLGGHGMVCSFEIGRLAARRVMAQEEAVAEEIALDPARLVPAT